MLRILTKPTSKLYIDPAEVFSRLGASTGEEDAIARLVGRASSILTGQLRFDPWYQELEEGFDSEDSTSLNLSGRPFASLVSVLGPGLDPLVEDEDFAVRYTGRDSGEAYLFRRDSWERVYSPAPAADWVVTYWAGWWLPLMSGTRPDEVDPLPDDLAEAAWIVCQDRYGADGYNPVVKSMSKAGAHVEYRDRATSLRGVGTTPTQLQALPPEAQMIVDRYAPIGI